MLGNSQQIDKNTIVILNVDLKNLSKEEADAYMDTLSRKLEEVIHPSKLVVMPKGEYELFFIQKEELQA